ncbi:AAA family ATPase [Burkholderia cenocepacia]|uniref:AAA family ATPase n=1 Tax=Burkholderia cenocepacia TaxID=95486 RepID=UPI001AA0C5DE|nr:AAA family ATPase [Burkholderia cenocepacia]
MESRPAKETGSMLRLKNIVQEYGLQVKEIARKCDRSRSALSLLVNHGVWPATLARELLMDRVMTALIKLGVPVHVAEMAFEEVAEPRANATPPMSPSQPEIEKEDAHMLIRKISLAPNTLEFFQIERDPFMPPTTRGEAFMGRALRVGYEHMLAKARYGGFLALIGESGAGKTTLKDLLIEELHARAEVVVIEPCVIGMEENDSTGKTLKATHIADAILREVAPFEKPKRSLEARNVQIREAMARGMKDNPKRRYLLLIEEAHRLPVPTLRHLKGFYELKAGGRQLLSILLLGQPELARRLSPLDMEIREVWQRCEIVRLEPLGKQLPDYLKHRLGKLASTFVPDALDALSARLTVSNQQRSFLYPLAVDNWSAAAMNLAAKVGAKQITAETIDAAYTEIEREYRAY